MSFDPYGINSIYGVSQYGAQIFVNPLASFFSYDANLVPRNLQAIYQDWSTVKLTWLPSISGIESGYSIKRAYTNDEILVNIGTTTSTFFIDSGVEKGREFYYRITSLISGLTLNNQNYIPKNLSVNQNYNGQNTLNWEAPINSVSGYRVYRSTQYDDLLVPIGSTTEINYIDSGLSLNQQYYYRVTSVF